jgi:hypothetical protein
VFWIDFGSFQVNADDWKEARDKALWLLKTDEWEPEISEVIRDD